MAGWQYFQIRNGWRWIPLLGLIVFSWFRYTTSPYLLVDQTRYSGQYLAKVQGFLKSCKETVVPGGFLKNLVDYNNIYLRYTTYYYTGTYLPYLRDGAMPVSLSDYEIPPINPENKIEYERQQNAINLGMFYRFVQQKKVEGRFTSIGQSQVDFVQQYKLQYLVVAKGARLSPELNTIVKTSFQDPPSGEMFCLFH